MILDRTDLSVKVHIPVWHRQPVPVDRCSLREIVRENYPYDLSLTNADLRPGYHTIIGPCSEVRPGSKIHSGLRCREAKLPHRCLWLGEGMWERKYRKTGSQDSPQCRLQKRPSANLHLHFTSYFPGKLDQVPLFLLKLLLVDLAPSISPLKDLQGRII